MDFDQERAKAVAESQDVASRTAEIQRVRSENRWVLDWREGAPKLPESLDLCIVQVDTGGYRITRPINNGRGMDGWKFDTECGFLREDDILRWAPFPS